MFIFANTSRLDSYGPFFDNCGGIFGGEKEYEVKKTLLCRNTRRHALSFTIMFENQSSRRMIGYMLYFTWEETESVNLHI